MKYINSKDSTLGWNGFESWMSLESCIYKWFEYFQVGE